MIFSERVLSLTQNYLLPKVVDNTLKGNVLSLRLIGNAEQGKGESIKRPIKYQNSGTATSFAGLDTFTANQLTTKVRMSFDMRAVRIPVAVSGMEAVANGASETQVTDLVKEALEETQQELLDACGNQIYGDGTGNSSKDFLGLAAAIDDGTNVSTYGTLSRTTYPVLKATLTAATSGVLSLSTLATLFTNVSASTSLSTPTLIVSAPAVWDFYEQLLTPSVRETYSMMGYYTVGRTGSYQRGTGNNIGMQGLSGTAGYTAVTYKGIPWVRDDKGTSGNVFMLNEDWLTWYGWQANGQNAFGYTPISLGNSTTRSTYNEYPMSDFTGFNWSGFRAPTNQFGGVADVIILGNLLSWQPRRHGRLTSVTTV